MGSTPRSAWATLALPPGDASPGALASGSDPSVWTKTPDDLLFPLNQIYLAETLDEVRFDRDFLVVGWSFVRSTILLFLIT